MLLSFLLFWMPVLHAQIRVSGKVIDEEHNPLVGVGVLLKGTTQGTVTAEDGTFEIDVPDSKSVLGISCIGFIEQEVHELLAYPFFGCQCDILLAQDIKHGFSSGSVNDFYRI